MNKCFIEECSEKADDVDKAIKCQKEECVTDAELSGRKRNSMGPTGTYRIITFFLFFQRYKFVSLVLTTLTSYMPYIGAGSLLSCGVGCAKDAGKIYKVSFV